MDTLVTIEVVSAEPEVAVCAAMQRALDWFALVERTCSRFDPASELLRLCGQVDKPVAVSAILFEAVQFTLVLARRTGGAFDPTLGDTLAAHGFDRHYVTGERTGPIVATGPRPRFRDVRTDQARRTVTLARPLLLDLGGVAKGLAIDLAEQELAAFEHVCIDAGGDIVARGLNPAGRPWRIGVQDPRKPEAIVHEIEVSGQAVCTSGDYERPTADGREHHLIDPATGHAARTLASVTVVAPTALAADGLATAAFVLGPERGPRLLEREGVGGVFITTTGDVRVVHGPPTRVTG